MIPYETGGFEGSAKNYKTLLIMIGPANCKRFAIVARIPDMMKSVPKYFLNDAIIFLVLDLSQS
jgi:hypothetical protein